MNGLITRGWLAPTPRLGSVYREIDALFEDVFGDGASAEPATDWAPRVESFVKDDALHVRADLPGVDPKAVDVSLEGDVLTVRGERKTAHEEPAYREVAYGRFERRIRVPDGVEPGTISAKYTNGVLHVTVPLPKPVSRKITIDVASNGTAS